MNKVFALPFGSASRSRFHRTLIIAASLLFANGCASTKSVVVDLQKSHTVNILTVNLRNILDVPCLDPAGNWTNRMDRMVEWIRTRNEKPDIIALQEAAGWIWCPTNFNTLNDYEQLFYILRGLNSDITVNYRIAYLTGENGGGRGDCGINGGTLGGCQHYSGKALLYNANKLVNLTALEASAAVPHDSPYNTIVFRRSLPACNVSAPMSSLVAFIDGPSGPEKCGQATPDGKVWIIGGTASTRFAWRNAVTARNEIHVYNVHLHDDSSGIDTRNANELIRFVEQRHPQNRLYPPVILGDFNYPVDGDGPRNFPGFRFVGYSDTTDTGIGSLIGERARFASEFDAASVTEAVLTGEACTTDRSRYWSDHCSLFISLRPQ